MDIELMRRTVGRIRASVAFIGGYARMEGQPSLLQSRYAQKRTNVTDSVVYCPSPYSTPPCQPWLIDLADES